MPDESLFLGTYQQHLDEKGRLILPAKFGEVLAPGIVITRGQEYCLYIYTQEHFNGIYENIRTIPISSKQGRDYLRVFLSGAHDEIPDRQRRVTVPPLLREYANLTQDLTVLGLGDHIEVWDTKTWEEHLKVSQEDYSNITEEIIPGIF